jgi:hypothetical protein
MTITPYALSFDGSDVAKVARFWSEVLGNPINLGATDAFASIDTETGLRFMFHQVPEGKVVKNRLHPDLVTSEYEDETARLLVLGATQLNNIEQGASRWRTFADPEGNEFDLVAR